MSENLLAQFRMLFAQNKYLVVDFYKKNGEHQVMTCSIHPEVLPEVLFESKSVQKRKTALTVLTVWDLTKKDWCSFTVDNVNMISSKNNETGEETVLYLKG